MSREQWGHGYWQGYWQGIQDASAGYSGSLIENIRECARNICLAITDAEKNRICNRHPKNMRQVVSIFKISSYSRKESANLIQSALYYIERFEPFGFYVCRSWDDDWWLCVGNYDVDDICDFEDWEDLEQDKIYAENQFFENLKKIKKN